MASPTVEFRRQRKRSILLALVVLVLLVSPLFALSLRGPQTLPAPERVVVQPGDTLWGLAERYGPPDRDLREVIYDIRQTNGLQGSLIKPGQVLLIAQD